MPRKFEAVKMAQYGKWKLLSKFRTRVRVREPEGKHG